MAIRCLFGHAWYGCRCTRCGQKRDQDHHWDGCQCLTCGQTRNRDHDYHYCTCIICGALSPNWDDHDYVVIERVVPDDDVRRTGGTLTVWECRHCGSQVRTP